MKFLPFTEFAPAKVNLALHVLGRRDDGYHELDSIVAFADAGDQLTFEPAGAFAITVTGSFARDLPSTEENIIARAWAKFRDLVPDIPPVHVRLIKNLPVASGIGGGSADAAAALRGFMKIVGMKEADDRIRALALSLGADVPVCLVGQACRMRGVGERIEVLENFSPVQAVLVNPLVPVATADVFRALGLAKGSAYRQPITDVTDPLGWRNDLTDPAIQVAPVIGEVLRYLRALTDTQHANMSGSGATCFALGAMHPHAGISPHWWSQPVVLR